MNSTESSQTLRRQKHLIGCQGKRMRLLILALLLIVFIYRGYLLINYCAFYVDDDQALMWNGAAAMAHLCFPEPCFWGQNYGSMFEALIAAPFYWLGIPLNILLPLATRS